MGKKKVKKEEEPENKIQEEPESKKEELFGEEKVIFDYMFFQNRPYNALNVHDNLGGSIKKPQVQRILDKLTESGKLQVKEFGKNKVYLINQALIPASDEAENLELDAEIQKLNEELQEIKGEVKDLQIKAKELENSLSLEEILEKIKEKERNLDEVNKEICELNKAGCVSEEQRKGIESKLKLVQSEEKKRLKMFNEVVERICEMLEEPKKKVKDLIGVEE